MSPGPLALSAMVVVAFVVLSLVGRRLGAERTLAGRITVGVALLLSLWVPQSARDIVLGFLFAFMMAFIAKTNPLMKGLIFLITAGIVGGLANLVPGGATVLVLPLIVLVGVLELKAQRKHRARIARAGLLEPNKDPGGEVVLSGTAEALKEVSLPETKQMAYSEDLPRGKAIAGWQLDISTEKQLAEPTQLAISTKMGLALVDLTTVQLSVNPSQERPLVTAEMTKVVRDRDIDWDPLPGKLTWYLRWIDIGQEVFVVGRPNWERAPEGEGTYRESPFVPVFRSTAAKPAWLAGRSARAESIRSKWFVAQWAVWGVCCLVVAGAQAFGVA